MSATLQHPAIEYLTALFEDNDVVCLTFIHGTKTYKHGGAVTENVFLPLSKVITEKGIARLMARNKAEHIYVSMAPFKPDSTKRIKANIAEVKHIFMEADDNGEDVLAAVRASVAAGEIPAPNIILCSSPSKYQFIWNVEGFDVATQEAMNETLLLKFGGDPASKDAARVLRVAGFRNIKEKYADPKPIAEIIEHNPSFEPHALEHFKIPLAVAPRDHSKRVAINDKALQAKIDLVSENLNATGVEYTDAQPWEDGAYKILLDYCPWLENHTNGSKSDAAIIVQPDGSLGFKCLHSHCTSKKWDDFRVYLENTASKKLRFSLPQSEKQRVPKSVGAAAAEIKAPDVDTAELRFMNSAPQPALALTQLGNAERYVEKFGKDTLYCPKMKQWFVWDGSRWIEDDMRKIHRNMTSVVRDILRESIAVTDKQLGMSMHKWARASESNTNINGALEHVKTLVAISAKVFDQNFWLFNFANGTLDLKTDEFREARRGDYLTKAVPYDYDASLEFCGDCPRWEKFLEEVFPGEHSAIIPYLQRAIGYSLTGDVREQCLWLMLGKGANGKGVFIHTLQKVLGAYSAQADWQTFAVRKTSGMEIREDIARLAGARFVAAAEGDKQTRMAENVVKAITGCDIITARHYYKGSFEFMPQFKLWLASNHEPKLIGTDDGIWRRLRYVPFTVKFEGNREDKTLESKLQEELPGILNWARRGLKDYLKYGMQTPDEVLQATNNFRQQSDQLNNFLNEKTTAGGTVAKGVLYEKYKTWADRAGETYTMPEREFNGALKSRGIADKHTKKGAAWMGLQCAEHGSVERMGNRERIVADSDDTQSELL